MKLKIIRIIVVVAIVAAAGTWYWRSRNGQPVSELPASGTVEATESRLGFQAAGRIASIAVDEGSPVRAGDVLAKLDTSELDARREQAVSRLDAANAILLEMQRGFRREEIGQAEAALSATQERQDDAGRDLDRTQKLYDGGAVSREIYDKAETAYSLAEAAVKQAQDQLTLVKKGVRSERIDAQKARVAEAEAAIRGIDATLANTVVVSPIDGIVTIRHREPNEIVSPGQPVVTLMNPADRWVRIYIPEDRIGAVGLGTKATITCDTWPGRTFNGNVIYIATEAEFTPKNVQTTEERVRLVYAVKVRIDDDPRMDLKPGMPVDVELDLREAPKETKG